MSHAIEFKYNYITILAILTLLNISCSKDMSISLGNGSSNSYGVIISDTLTVSTSTLLLDDIPTSNTGSGLIGSYTDAQTGKVNSNYSFRLSTSLLKRSIPEDARYDSVTLVVFPNKFTYGDTTKALSFSVHELDETLELVSNSSNDQIIETPVFLTKPSIYNKTKVKYNQAKLGEATFIPFVSEIDSINVKLNDTFGRDLYNKINSKSVEVSSDDNFNEYIKGLAIISNDFQNKSVIGITDSVLVRIHYSSKDNDGFDKDNYEELIINKTYSYNNITFDRAQTIYEDLNYNTNELSSTVTAGNTFIQAGTGVVSKITFPYLKDYLSTPDIAINKAELTIEVEGIGDPLEPLPNALILFIGNNKNIPESILPVPFSSGSQTAYLTPGSHTSNGQYVFNLTSYLTSIMQDKSYDTKNLLLSVPTSELLSSINILKVLTKNNKAQIKLNIVYTKF